MESRRRSLQLLTIIISIYPQLQTVICIYPQLLTIISIYLQLVTIIFIYPKWTEVKLGTFGFDPHPYAFIYTPFLPA